MDLSSRGDKPYSVELASCNLELMPVLASIFSGIDRAIGISDAQFFIIVRVGGKTAGHMRMSGRQAIA